MAEDELVPDDGKPWRFGGRVRGWLGMVGVLAALGVLLMPAWRSRQHASVTGGPGLVSPAPSADGPTLAQVWPGAQAVDMPAVLADGSAFSPLMVLDRGVVLGTANNDHSFRLMIVSAAAAPRVLATFPVDGSPDIPALAATGSRVFWMQTQTDAAGAAHTGLWAAERGGGPPRVLVADAGPVLFTDSRFDLQIADGRLWWVATPGGGGHSTQLRSVLASGGPVAVRALPGDYALTAWPWLTSSPDAAPGSVQMYNLRSGVRRTVAAPADRRLTCTPAWCRIQAADALAAAGFDVLRLDGSARQHVAEANATPVVAEVALRDRFELVAIPTPTSSAEEVIEQVRLYDLLRRRSVLIHPHATDAGARGDYVWWATVDNEAVTWHLLDLHTLT